MKDLDQQPLIECPIYEDDLARVREKKRKAFTNNLMMQLNRIMNYFRIETADLHKRTGLSYATLHDWVQGKVEAQMLDDGIPLLVKALDPDMTIDFMVYGIPKSSRDFELDERMPDLDEKTEVDFKEAN